jgi:hypothetical protein
MRPATSLTGVAGEHYILFELLRQGYIAALAPPGVPDADIVVTNRPGTRLCSIQVKTRRGVGHDKGWHMQDKHEKTLGERHFYCFVNLEVNLGMAPDVYVIPNADVAKVIKTTHAHWLGNPGKKGQSHKPTRLRRLMPDFTIRDGEASAYKAGWMNKYLNSWHLLGLDQTDPDAQLS